MCKRFLLLIAGFLLLSASTLSFSMNIFEAIEAEDFDRVRELVEVEKIDVNNIVDGGGRAPLYWACMKGSLAIVRLILPSCTDATINKVDVFGRTSLFKACCSDNLAIVQLLLEHGANVDERAFFEAQNRPRSLFGAQNRLGILRLINLVEGLDNSNNMLGFIDDQIGADKEFLSKRFWKKHFRILEGQRVRARVKRLLLEKDERVPMDSVCCVNGTTRIFNCIA